MAKKSQEQKTITPNQLAVEIAGEENGPALAKRIRAYLRQNGHRDMTKERGQAWSLTQSVANEVREKFAPKESAAA